MSMVNSINSFSHTYMLVKNLVLEWRKLYFFLFFLMKGVRTCDLKYGEITEEGGKNLGFFIMGGAKGGLMSSLKGYIYRIHFST